MIYEVTKLRNAGLRLRQSELQPPLVGKLRMFDWDGAGNNFRRWIRVLDLEADFGHGQPRPIARMADPQLIAVLEDGVLVFSGIELESNDGRVLEHVQVWRVRPTLTAPDQTATST